MSAAELLKRIEKLTDIGIALSSERDIQSLLEQILLGAKALTNADGGTLYLVNEENQTVAMEIVHTDSLDFAMGGTTGKPIPFAPIPLYDNRGNPNNQMVVTSAVLNDQTINIEDAYDTDAYDFSGTVKFDQSTGYRSTSFLTVPLKNHQGDIIAVLQLLNALDEQSGAIISFSSEAQHLAESLASQAAIALTNRNLINDLKTLLESLIQLIATAIDEKSPYTGGHCRRVPVITMMLADAADQSQDHRLETFKMSEDDRYELEMAAWLHDCGKITTPEAVVDKATKLQTIYDRIETLATRYEVLKRDAEILMLKQQLVAAESGSPLSPAITDTYHATLKQLDDEFTFLESSNTGGEFMAESDQQRVREIAERTWQQAGNTLPLLDRDEIYNLTIAKGTLTEEERSTINNHIVATIRMLESLPFPKHLKNVPEFAGGHHERFDGKGYPRGLTGAQMSVQARIMVIADIFEALTAKDRPYKDGMKLSTSLSILGQMSLEGHIDPDLFQLFIKEKVYLRYAEEYLEPGQFDEIDESQIPGYFAWHN